MKEKARPLVVQQLLQNTNADGTRNDIEERTPQGNSSLLFFFLFFLGIAWTHGSANYQSDKANNRTLCCSTFCSTILSDGGVAKYSFEGSLDPLPFTYTSISPLRNRSAWKNEAIASVSKKNATLGRSLLFLQRKVLLSPWNNHRVVRASATGRVRVMTLS